MSNITFAPFPIPVVTPKGSGYIVYVKCNAMWENDEVCVAMDDGGQYFHYNTGQLQAFKNATYGIGAAEDKSYTEQWFENFNKGLTNRTKSDPIVFAETWPDEKLVEWAAFYSRQENHLDPKTILEKFKNRNK